MRKTPVQHSVRWSLAAVILPTLITTATAGAFMRECAARDMQILMLVEEQESKNAASAEKSREAMLK